MKAFDLISKLFPAFVEAKAKVHLASFNGIDRPIDVYLAGDFPGWQSDQNSQNFEREYVVALIELQERYRWLFAGVWRSLDSVAKAGGGYRYQLEEVADCSELSGRLVVTFQRPGRNSYLLAEKWSEQIQVSEIRAAPMTTKEFPGYRKVDLSFVELRNIVHESAPTWRAALSGIAGIYLITDMEEGKLYVGSACGEGGIWRRWVDYATTGHGGNKELRDLMKGRAGYPKNWRYSILELIDVAVDDEAVLVREAHWKKILLSRTHGLNAN